MKRRKKLTPIEDFLSQDDDKKHRIAAEFDKEMVIDTFRPLSRVEKQVWRRAKKKLGRPVKGKGHRVIAVSVEKGLLERADRYAKNRGLTRASLIALGLESVLAKRRPRAA